MPLNDQGQIIVGSKRVQLNPYRPRPFKSYDVMTDADLLARIGGTLMVDTECFPNFFLIAFKDTKTKKILTLSPPFNERQLSWIMHNYQTVSFNGLKYDLPLIWYSYTNQNEENIKNISNEIIIQNTWPQELAKNHNFKIHPTQHVDLIEVAPLKGSLKLYMARLHAKRIQDLPISDTKYLTEEEKLIVIDYCVNDLDGTELLFDNLTEQLKLREQLSVEYRQDLMSKSDAQIAEAVIGSELKRLTGYWPKKPKIDNELFFNFQTPANLFFQTEQLKLVLKKIEAAKFSLDFNGRLEAPKDITDLKILIGQSIYSMGIGGLHSSEENRAVTANDEFDLEDIDVESYYPKIVLNLKLHPKHIGDNFFAVYSTIVERRLAAKKAKNLAVSENLKVTINGTFGKTGSPYSILYAPEMTIQITVGGQLYLLMLIEQLELNGISVVSANTDGILVRRHKNQKELCNKIVTMWEEITKFKTEKTNYKAVYSRDVNAYLAITLDNKPKGKNVYYDPWTGKTAKDAYWRFQKNSTAQICVEAITKLITDNIPIEKTIQDCKDITRFVCVKNVTGGAYKNNDYLGKVVRWYWAKDELGTINYIASNNKVPDSEGGIPVMDLPECLPTNIDFDKYISKAREMLFEMDYLKRPKQIDFFSD